MICFCERSYPPYGISLPFPLGGSNLEAVETVTLVDNLLQLSQREREASAEQRMRESQELAQYLSQEHPQREATPPLLGGGVASDESDTSGEEEEEEQVVGVADRIPAEISHAHNVPSIGGKRRLPPFTIFTIKNSKIKCTTNSELHTNLFDQSSH